MAALDQDYGNENASLAGGSLSGEGELDVGSFGQANNVIQVSLSHEEYSNYLSYKRSRQLESIDETYSLLSNDKSGNGNENGNEKENRQKGKKEKDNGQKLIVVTKEEQTKYKEFLKFKKDCCVTAQNINDKHFEEKSDLYEANDEINEMIKQFYKLEKEKLDQLMIRFNNIETQCNNHWQMAENENDNIDTILLMDSTIEQFKEMKIMFSQMKNEFVSTLNALKMSFNVFSNKIKEQDSKNKPNSLESLAESEHEMKHDKSEITNDVDTEQTSQCNFMHNGENCNVYCDANGEFMCIFKIQGNNNGLTGNNGDSLASNNSNVSNSSNDSSNRDNHGWSTVIFKPTINENLNGNKTKHSMTIELIRNECQQSWYKNFGYYMQCGIIGIPKSKSINGDNLSFENIFSQIDGCALDNIGSKHESLEEFEIETYYIFYACNSYSNQYACYLGHNSNLNHATIYDSNKNFFMQPKYNAKYCIKAREKSKHKHCVQVLIENNQLHFIRWVKDKSLTMKDSGDKNDAIMKTTFDDIELDFNKFDYYYALSSRHCGCRGPSNGFEFLASMC